MKRVCVLPLLVIAVLIAGGSLLASYASFSFQHPRAPQARFTVDPRRGAQLASDPVPLPAPGTIALPPQIEVEETSFDFGMMNPYSIGEHRFVIHNRGKGPLHLRDGGSSCKCTLAEISDHLVQPGESTEVLLQWNTGTQTRYAQRATIRTNDPLHSEIQFRITGNVDTVVAVDRETVNFGNMLPDQGGNSELLVYSSRWSDLELVSVQSSIAALQWTTQPASEEALLEAGGKSGIRIHFELPAEIATGELAGTVLLSVRSANGQTAPMIAEVDVRGHKLGRYSLIGSAIDSSGLLQLGVVPQGQSSSQKLILRSRDAQPPAANEWIVEATPEFLQVSMNERSTSAARGLFDVTISIPSDAPACAYLGSQTGEIIIRSPRGDDRGLRMRVEFAVMAP